MAGMNDTAGNNDTIFSAEYLGSLGYQGTGASHLNFYRSELLGPDDFNHTDLLDWYRFGTVGLDEIKIDISPFGIPQSGNFQAGLAYKVIVDDVATSVVMLFDGGNQDGILSNHLDDFRSLGYDHVIYEDRFFSPEFDPHLLFNITPGQEIFLEVSSPGIEVWNSDGDQILRYDPLTYIMDISPRSSSDEVGGDPNATDGDDVVDFLNITVDFDGGAGTDTISFVNEYPPYNALNPGSNPNWNIEVEGKVVIVNGYHRFTNVERLEFSDGVLAFDITGSESVAGQCFRLYQAAFDRLPDAAGLGYWVDRLDSGTTTLNAIAQSFLHSPEFVQTFGTEQTVSNSHFVELLYLHTLGRQYDQGGFDYWVERLDGGHTNRGDLLAFFSESDENVARVTPAVEDGIWFI